MRILHILDHSAPLHSGYVFRTLAILREQRRMGWETAHVTSIKHEATAAALAGYRAVPVEDVQGLQFYRTPHPGGVTERIPGLGQWSVVTSLRRRLSQIVDAAAPHILHAHSPSLNGMAALAAARKYHLPFVYELRALWEDAGVDHGTTRQGGLRYLASRRLETHVLHRADAVVTICEGLRREIVARGVPDQRVTVVPNAVDVEAFKTDGKPDPDLLDRLGLRGCNVLGFIGSFYAYEGLALLLEALPAIQVRYPKTKLILVGGGFQERELKQRVAARGLEEAVIFAGRVPHDNVHAYYQLVDVFVYPRLAMRLTELVTPLKPLEAMAHERLVVASDVGGHRELIRDGQTGLLFRAGDVAALSARVTEALEMGERSRAIRAAARTFVDTERTWQAVVKRYADVYTAAREARDG